MAQCHSDKTWFPCS